MGLVIQKAYFKSRDEVLADVGKHGTWPTTFVSGPSDGLPVHWHSDEVQGYVMEGETSFLDAESARRTPVGPGDKITIPARCLHAEGPVADRVVYIIALPEPRLSDDFLLQRPPEEL